MVVGPDLPRAEPQTGLRGGKHAHNAKCEPITIPLCTNIEYNMTIMPNLLGKWEWLIE